MVQTLEQLSDQINEIIRRLEKLPPQHCTAFSAACCERLVPNYRAFSTVHHLGEFDILKQALETVWQSLNDRSVTEDNFKTLLVQLEKLMLDFDEHHSIFVEQAAYAVDTVVSTLQYCVSGEKEYVANIVEILATTTETYLRDVALPYTRTFISKDKVEVFDQWIWNSPLLTGELESLKGELDILEAQANLNPKFLENLKERARLSGINMIERGIVVSH
jgi:hypothetical protein